MLRRVWSYGIVLLVGSAFALARPALADQSCRAARVALVIGNAAYPDSEATLREPIDNAKALAGALTQIGFATTESEDLSRDKMQAAIAAFEDKLAPETIAFVFFSGYGIQSEGHTYLIPVDAKIWTEQDVRTFGFNLDRLIADLAAHGATQRIVVVDAARRNPYERRFRLSGSSGLAAIKGTPGILALYSSGPGTTFEEAGGPTSPFVPPLVKEMVKPGATAEDAFRRTRIDVSHNAGAGATPWVSSFLGEDVSLRKEDCSSAPTAAKPQPSSPGKASAAATPRQPVPPPAPAVQAAANPPPPVAVPEPAPPPPAPAPAPPPPAPAPVPTPPEAAPAEPPPPTVAPQPPARQPPPPPPATEAANGEGAKTPPAASPTASATSSDAPIDDPALLDEVRDRLFEQNYDPGNVGSPKMTQAMRAFAQKSALPATDRPTMRILRSLREAPSLKPWGAFTFSQRLRTWGMSWGSPTRREALAVARARCGSDQCLDEASFFGKSCGAFALSAKNWAMTWREGVTPARQSALNSCGQHGPACRIVGAVCADGSGRSP